MIKTDLPVIILRGIVLLPNNDIRLEFDNDNSKNIIDVSELFHDNKILVVSKENPLEESLDVKELPNIGVISKITHKMELPNGKVRVIITGIKRAKIHEYLNLNKKDDILESIISEIEEEQIEEKQEKTLINKLYRELELYTKMIPYVSNSVLSIVSNITSLSKMTDIIVPYLQITQDRILKYLLTLNEVDRLKMILEDIYNEEEMFQIEKELDSKVKQGLDESQKEYLLKEKLKVIKKELGDTSLKEEEIIKLNEKISSIKLPIRIKNRLNEEINRYEILSETSPEINVTRNYIDWLLNIPWDNYTKDNDNLNEVLDKLNKSHKGLEEVKTRIIEYLAVSQISKNNKSPIICLVGPPGVGKTSIAKSIAEALNRNFIKISVGGINDESELIGHRKTYLGSSPGRIIQSLKKSKSMNPLFLIDEIDKMTKDYKGDPASILLEILDKEQNKYFSDNYIEEEVDLSKIMFITTANSLDTIPEPLKDRLEIIELSGYTEYEKLEIAKNHLIPKVCKECGINEKGLIIEDKTIIKIINEYTKEAGVRQLERLINKIVRKVVTQIIVKKITLNKFIINEKNIEEYLGIPKYIKNKDKKNKIGVVNGLAYTPYGGSVIKIETTKFKGKGNLELTGSLGEVMKESSKIAFNYLKANYQKYKIDYNQFIQNDFHIHVPEGAIKKDGPSAGIALTTSLLSLLTNKKINDKIAMTGEISLTGSILPIGGLKEKSIGALNQNIKTILLPTENKKDLEELPDEVKEKIEFVFVKDYIDIYNYISR